ncbi:hypothetical protein LIER_39808 [Lithospermum erythrorhizon]|uniref:CCHC-type domain-containing protein n=1 Tax=Lithospermum erythrorhizon TaxID=34254 RepID=A0AAV3QKC6_LITER
MVRLEEEDLADGLVACEASVYVNVLSLKDVFLSIKNSRWLCLMLGIVRTCRSLGRPPIRRMVKFLVGRSVAAGYLAYERLPHICFRCGLFGHFVRQCPDLPKVADL